MERIQLRDDLSFSKIIHGMWRLESWDFSTAQCIDFIEKCIEMGITTFDHADIYGSYTCEQIFGEALKEKPALRDQIEIVTKCGISLVSPNRPQYTMNHYNTTKEHIIKSVETSLQNFHTDQLDVVLIHRVDPLMNPEDVASAFQQLKQEGKVRHFGVSNFTVPQLNMLQAYLDESIVTNQIEVSPLCLEHFQNGVMEWLAQYKVKPMIWSPLAGGRLFTDEGEDAVRVRGVLAKIAASHGVDIDTIAYAWLNMHPVGMMPIVGSGKIERVQKAVDSLKVTLTREQWYEIFIAAQGYPLP
ncbi:MAG: aldo/keto reductase family oxidoreductase [Bacillaceae bacterium]